MQVQDQSFDPQDQSFDNQYQYEEEDQYQDQGLEDDTDTEEENKEETVFDPKLALKQLQTMPRKSKDYQNLVADLEKRGIKIVDGQLVLPTHDGPGSGFAKKAGMTGTTTRRASGRSTSTATTASSSRSRRNDSNDEDDYSDSGNDDDDDEEDDDEFGIVEGQKPGSRALQALQAHQANQEPQQSIFVAQLAPNFADEQLAKQLAITERKGQKGKTVMGDAIKAKVKEEAWRTIKFANGPKEREIVTTKILDWLQLKGYTGSDPVSQAKRAKWIRAFEGVCCQKINQQRSYVQVSRHVSPNLTQISPN